jgi:hypothetical protein
MPLRARTVASRPQVSLSLVARRTPAAPAADALDRMVFLQLLPRHPADARAVEVGRLGLDALQTAELLSSEQFLGRAAHTFS